MTFEYWFMFPIAIIISTVAMSTLVGGATFFSPFFILFLKLETNVAIATGLTIQFFGFSTGLIKYAKQKCIDYKIGTTLLIITIPYAIFGVYLSTKLNPYFIRTLLALTLIYIGYNLLTHNRIKIKNQMGRKEKFLKINLYQRDSKTINFNKNDFRKDLFLTSIGSILMGTTSAGLGEIIGSNWIKNTKTNLRTIVSTTIFIIAITTLITSINHLYNLSNLDNSNFDQIINILIFAIPGVLIGGNIGPQITKNLNQDLFEKVISIILIITGCIFLIPL